MDPEPEAAIHSERHIRIICIGAGASGLCLAYKLQRSFQNFTLTVCCRKLTLLAKCMAMALTSVLDIREKPGDLWNLV